MVLRLFDGAILPCQDITVGLSVGSVPNGAEYCTLEVKIASDKTKEGIRPDFTFWTTTQTPDRDSAFINDFVE